MSGVTDYRRKLVREWITDPDAAEPRADSRYHATWAAGVRWRERATAADPKLFEDLAAATARLVDARARLTAAQDALSDEQERVARERDAERKRAEAERREARRTRFEFGQTREPGKGILAWPYDAEPEAPGVWVVEVRVEDGVATIYAADEPSRVRLERVSALDLKPPTRADLSRYLDVDLLDAVDIETAIEDSPDPVDWYVYDPAKWERRVTDVIASDGDDEAGDADAWGARLGQAYSDGARTNKDFGKALGITPQWAGTQLRDARWVRDGQDVVSPGVGRLRGSGFGRLAPRRRLKPYDETRRLKRPVASYRGALLVSVSVSSSGRGLRLQASCGELREVSCSGREGVQRAQDGRWPGRTVSTWPAGPRRQKTTVGSGRRTRSPRVRRLGRVDVAMRLICAPWDGSRAGSCFGLDQTNLNGSLLS